MNVRKEIAAAALVVTAMASGAWAQPVASAPQPAAPAAQPPRPLYADARPVRSCESLKSVTLPNTTIESAVVDASSGADVCRVTAIVTHPPAGDVVTVWVALPATNWNGRFQGVGGGGLSGGSANSLRTPSSLGYAAGSTDTGHQGGSGSFALDAYGRYNWMLIRDNSYLGIHAMTVTAKALVDAFYGKPARYSYFNGCSTGGRQGLMEAQRYPADYDGILAGAPAINFPQLHVAQMWGPLVMLQAKHFVSMCKYAMAIDAAVAACDEIDKIKDGVIEDPTRCTYDPKALVGMESPACEAFTEADAAVIRKIWEGPRRQDGTVLWYGLPRSAPFALSATGGTPLNARPFAITLDWFRYFLTQNPSWDWTTLTHGAYEQLWDQSVEQFGPVLGTDNPDLSAYRARGGKIVLWHGWADQLIYAGGTIDYVKRVHQRMGGAARTAEFLRFFLAPGVGHCVGGNGPAPTRHFDALMQWVEEGKAPDTLEAVRRGPGGAVFRSRPLCQYPLVARYKGKGSTDDAANFECKPDF